MYGEAEKEAKNLKINTLSCNKHLKSLKSKLNEYIGKVKDCAERNSQTYENKKFHELRKEINDLKDELDDCNAIGTDTWSKVLETQKCFSSVSTERKLKFIF